MTETEWDVPLLAPGWYRATKRGLERIPDADVQAVLAKTGGFDVVHVELYHEEVPLW